jgi:serine/threonine protein phosphatase 1
MFDLDPTIKSGDTVAVGDVHGRFDLLSKFVEHVSNTGANIILLGDLVDRGPQPLEVVQLAKQLLDDPKSFGLTSAVVLKGNHEQMLLDALSEIDRGPRLYAPESTLWIRNGGNPELVESFQEHREWLDNLPLYHVVGKDFFVHAGVMPCVDLKSVINGPESARKNMFLWIREPFIAYGPKFNKKSPYKRVIHGHTPMSSNIHCTPKKDRICIDTGAYYYGVLTSFNATRNTIWRYTDEE